MTFNPSEHLMNLKGKQYLEVKFRIQWFREEHPDGTINTELIAHETDLSRSVPSALFKATASYVTSDGVIASASSHGSEEKTDFGDYVEKAETKAIGRALAALGYGTAFCEDHTFGADKGRVVDAPVQRQVKGNAGGGEAFGCEECGTKIVDSTTKAGKLFTAEDKVKLSQRDYGAILCYSCQKRRA